MKTTTSHLKEIVMQGVFTACACISILAVALICIFLFANGLPTIFEIGSLKFLLGTTWKPGNNLYGILPMILGSIYVTAGAIIVGVPIGLLTAIYMSRFASPRINKVLLPAVQLLEEQKLKGRRRLLFVLSDGEINDREAAELELTAYCSRNQIEQIKLTFDEGDKYGYEHTTIINLHKFIAQKIVEKGIDY